MTFPLFLTICGALSVSRVLCSLIFWLDNPRRR